LPPKLERTLKIDERLQDSKTSPSAATARSNPVIPGEVLLYHALASANVYPPAIKSTFQLWKQLDVVENYIYGRRRARLGSVHRSSDRRVRYQYRDRDHTTHRQHADLAFSRTGIARVATSRLDTYRKLADLIRGLDTGNRGFRILPARYGVFIAERRPQSPNGSVMRGVTWMPR